MWLQCLNQKIIFFFKPNVEDKMKKYVLDIAMCIKLNIQPKYVPNGGITHETLECKFLNKLAHLTERLFRDTFFYRTSIQIQFFDFFIIIRKKIELSRNLMFPILHTKPRCVKNQD